MDNIKLEEVEHTSNGDHIYAEKQTCPLEENDTQCGHVFYNEISRLLKFYCTYCRETYDNIEYFCQHLSQHIRDTTEDITNEEANGYKEQEEYQERVDEEKEFSTEDKCLKLPKGSREFKIPNYSTHSDEEDTEDTFEYEQQIDNSISSEVSDNEFASIPIDDYDNSEMIIEEIDDADEIRAEVEQEMRQSIEEVQDECLFFPENSSSAEIVDYAETSNITKTTSKNDNTKASNSFEDCFIKETNIDKIRSEGVCVFKEKKFVNNRKPMQKRRSNIQDILRLKRRRKKVTTVKVIAVKNRIAELYERIRNEQEKSQQIFSSDFLNIQQEQETQDAIESLMNDEHKRNENTTEVMKSNDVNKTEEIKSPNTDVTRKIIGETLITLIPEGTKIPNKFPSPIKKSLSTNLKNETTTHNISYTEHEAQNGEEKKAVCPACGKIFRSHFSLTIHKRIHYLESDSSVKLAHKCSDCDQLFNKLSQLKRHVEAVHYPEGFICKICNRQLSSLSLLERHMVKVHLDRPFNCKECNKNFSDPMTFEEHLASHTSGEVLKCTICGRKYATEYFLSEHMRNHKEQVPQTCVVCGKVTLRITQHMKIHTPRPKRLLSCSVCGKVFNFSSGLSHHFKIMHKLPRPPPKPKKESNPNAIKRKRRSPRTNERATATSGRKKQQHAGNSSSSTDTSFVINNEKFSDQIIEEQIEVPHEVYATTTPSILHLEAKEVDHRRHSQTYQTHQQLMQNSHHHTVDNESDYQQQEDVNHKEEEAKRVIVELIQNSTYSSFFPDNLSSVLEVTPPIAREETISAVNSIVNDC